MALLDIVTKGTTDYSTTIKIVDSSDGTPETSVVFNTTGIDLWYRRPGGAHTSITEATQTEGGAHTDGGFVHISDGEYRLDLPDAAVATGVDYVDIGGTVTGMIVIGGRIKLTDFDLGTATQAVDVTSISGDTAAANNLEAAYDGTGYAGGTIKQEVDIVAISGDTTSATNLEAYTDGTTPMPVNLTQWRGTQPAALSNTFVQSSAQEIAAGLITAAAVATDAIDADALAADGIAEIVADIMTEVIESQGSYTVQQALSVMLSVLAGVTSSGGTTIATPNGVSTRVAATTDASNNRTAMTITPSS